MAIIKGGLTLIQQLQKLFGARNVSDMMGRTTNVRTTAQGTNNPFANTFSKKYLKKNPDGVEEASKVIMENMQFAFGNRNAQQMKNFQNNVDTLFEIKFPPAKAEAEILDLSTKKQVTGEGLDSLKNKMGLPQGVTKFSNQQAREYSANIESYRRPIIREMLLKDTKIKLPDNVRKSLENKMDLARGADPKMDPLRLLDEYYDVNFAKLDELEDIRFTAKNEFEAADEFLKKGGLEPKKPTVRESLDDEAVEMAEQSDLDDDIPFAQGGIAGQLHLNKGGRVGFANGGLYDGDFYKEEAFYQPELNRINPNYTMQDYISKGAPLDFLNQYYNQERIRSELNNLESILGGYDFGGSNLQEDLVPLKTEARPYNDPSFDFNNLDQYQALIDKYKTIDLSTLPKGTRYGRAGSGYYQSAEEKTKDLENLRKSYLEDGYFNKHLKPDPIALAARNLTPKTATPTTATPTTAAPTTAAPTTAAPTPTGIQTIPGDKKVFNVMMDEKGNVQDDQSLTELFRETGTAPYIGQNNQINSMSDVFRLAGITNEGGISMGTDYGGSRTLPSGGIANTLPSVEQRMQAAAAKGLDARMGRTYAENIQAMADPRMATQMPPMPIDLMLPMSSEFRQGPGEFADPNVSAANPGGYASQDEAIADLGIERYNELYNMGGRVGFKKGGGMDRRMFLKLMGGLASIPVFGKLFKGAKVASKVVPLKNTTTTMPAWFPDLVDKFVAKGVGKKIDQDIMEYTVKELPDVKLLKQDNGAIRVEGKNAYSEEYLIDYEPPGVEIVDFDTGKTVKTKGDFVATDTEYRMISPEDYDIDGVNVNDIDELLGGSSNQLEGFAKGTGKTKNTIGQRRIDEASARGADKDESLRADINDPYGDIDPTDFVEPEDFAKGGLAGQLL